MVKEFQVYEKQNLFDVSLIVSGDVINAFEISKANNISLTAQLEVGSILKIPSILIEDILVLNFYRINGIKPATELTKDKLEEVLGCEGIGCWYVENDFIVQ